MLKRMTHLLNTFSRKESEAKLNKQMQKTMGKSIEVNGNGTPGYTVKKGKNAGKVLKHLKKESGSI
tara:strand:- start:616 stop:813 length:198 start_codon:yes stop_codon:yes gene_type:complete